MEETITIERALNILETRRNIMRRNYEKNREKRIEYARQQYQKKKEEKKKKEENKEEKKIVNYNIPLNLSTNLEFLKHWNYYTTSNLKAETYTCSCGAILKPAFKTPIEKPTKTTYSQLVHRLVQHLNTKKHSTCIQRIEDFVDYLENTFKKPVFNKVWDNYISEQFGELEV